MACVGKPAGLLRPLYRLCPNPWLQPVARFNSLRRKDSWPALPRLVQTETRAPLPLVAARGHGPYVAAHVPRAHGPMAHGPMAMAHGPWPMAMAFGHGLWSWWAAANGYGP